jgi:predicted MFS family arabinose efflux permease
MEPAFQTWLSRNTPEGARGGVFGFSNTFKALGWACASLCSTGVAMSHGIRSTFIIAAILFICIVPLVFIGAKRGAGTSIAEKVPGPST